MADEIIRIDKNLKDSDSTVESWDICYKVEDGADTETFVININGDDMTDRTDQSEAETLANTEAATKKSDWITRKADKSSFTNVTTTPKSVTL